MTSTLKRSYLIQAICGVCAIFAFFFLPYFTKGDVAATAHQLAANNGLPDATANQQYDYLNSDLWLQLIIALSITAVAGWQALRSREKPGRATIASLLGAVALLALIVALGYYMFSVLTGDNAVLFYSFGFWAFIAAMVVTFVTGLVTR